MTAAVDAIYRLQSIDAEIDEKKENLDLIEAELANNDEVLATRETVQAQEEIVRQYRSRLRGEELDLEEVLDKISATERALYGGRVTNPKELAGLEQELDYLRRRQSTVEDDALLLMGKVEDQEAKLRSARELLSRAEQLWRRAQSDLGSDAEQLRSRLDLLETERKGVVRGISEENLAVYEGLRRQKDGKAVVLLKDGVCQGCRVALPTSVAQRVRRGDELIRCSSCQRVLYSP